MSNKTQTTELPQSFLVNRDGSLDTEWLQLHIQQERTAMLKECGRQALSVIGHSALFIGKSVLNGLDEFVASGR